MRVTLNLATRPFADLGPAIKRLRIAMGVLALVAILLAFGLHAIHQKAEAARARDHSLDGQIASVTQERQGYENMMRQPDNAKLLQQAALLNKLIDDKSFSWTLAMEDLETVLPGGVQVTALEPQRSKDGRTTTLHLRVVGPRDRSVDLVRNLEHSKRFVLPRIVGETAETTDRPGQRLQPVSASDRVDFDILADYTPATPEDRKAGGKAASKLAGEGERPASSRRSAGALPSPRRGGLNPAPLSSAPLSLAPLTPASQGRSPYTSPVQPMKGPPRGVPMNQVPSDGPSNGIRRTPIPSQPQPQSQPQNQPGGPQ
jgi:type IV pilus assembly protein PilN